jgi:predicted DnaQ family exonuclease/DinG family helicase
MPQFVAIDLETTGMDPERDSIIEVGAIRFSLDGDLGESFASLVALERPLPPEIARLTGIQPEELAAAPPLGEVLTHLERFVGDAWIVGHNVAFDLEFLEGASLRPPSPSIDTAELASLLRPTTPSYALQRLIVELEAASLRPHRALDDATAAALLCGALLRGARGLNVETLEGAFALAPLIGEGIAFFFEHALQERARVAFSEPPLTPAERPRAGDGSALEADIRAIFAPDGPLASAFVAYEPRAEQVLMAEAVDQTFRDGGALVVEAGTGTGKSLAYLVPALRATRRGRRVVISTYTLNLQEQLVRKDVPQLLDGLDIDARAVVLKGRQNYLCPRRWHLLRATAQTPEEARLALKTLVWREATRSGDRGELHLSPEEALLWRRVCAQDETCTARRCASVRGGCYLEKARKAAEEADVIVVNHALLLSDARGASRLLPAAPLLVVDEAHHFEEVAAKVFGVRLEAEGLRRALRAVAHGPLPQLLAGSAHAPQVAAVREEAERGAAAIAETFAALSLLVPPAEARGYEDRLRVTDATRSTQEWLAVELAAERLRDALAGTAAAGERLVVNVGDLDGAADPAMEMAVAVRALRDTEAAIGRAVHTYRPSEICWLTLDAGDEPVLQTEPAHAGALIARHVTERTQAAVFTSATLAVAGSLDFALDRFGLGDRAASLRLGSPFDFRRQALLVVPSGLLDPYEPGFVDQLADTIAAITRALEGRTLVLFTAHTMLEAVRERLPSALEGTDVIPLAQGVDGSRRQLLDLFALGRAVLLGTASFWEGVDLPGDVLRCVVIAKLPFPVPDDPVMAGRAERYDDPFLGYHLPVAALRLRQGFGRLIRTRGDRGAVVLCDSRVDTRAYGEVLLSSLPPCALATPDVDAVASVVAEWCAVRGSQAISDQ